jgi:putative nucleotidyltransferase with HDIG domain
VQRTLGVTAQPGFVPGRGAAVNQAPARGSEEPTVAPSKALWLLIITVAVTGLALAISGAFSSGDLNWQVLIVLTALAVFAERSDLSLYGDSRVSLAFVPIFASLILCGLPGLAIVVTAASISSAFDRPLYKTAFNFGALMLAGAAATLVAPTLGDNSHAYNWPVVLGLTVLAGGINFATNSLLVATAIAINNRAKIKVVWAEHFLWLWPHYVVLSLLGLAVAAAYQAMGLWGIAVFTAPPVMMRLSIKQYLDRTTTSVLELRDAHGKLQSAHEQLTSAMASLGSAYDGTLRSLVAALDARDSETAGHSERVADLTMAIGVEMGIPSDTEEWQHISWGALLHDVGKIAIADGILRKPGHLTAEEWDAMRTHPHAGYEILRQVDFLAPAADIVLAHHERYDGKGYPRGLVGDQIPLGARIFMIADAFDAMTSDRTYRSAMPAEEALAEILRNSGTQFDPGAVMGFLSVYRRRFVGAGQQKGAGGHSHHGEPKLSQVLEQAIREAIGAEPAS